ncbi:hypothetical protein BDN72DRAFT_732984, partial [Pluteus cervinus]
LLEQMGELCSKRNSLAPVSQLPPEVLVQIFGWLQSLYRHEAEWTRVTQVYTYWRRTARGSPSLWTRVMWRNPFWLEESLTHSQPLPL